MSVALRVFRHTSVHGPLGLVNSWLVGLDVLDIKICKCLKKK